MKSDILLGTLENIAHSSRVWFLKPSTASIQQFYTFTVWEKMFHEILHCHFHFHLQCGEMFLLISAKKNVHIEADMSASGTEKFVLYIWN